MDNVGMKKIWFLHTDVILNVQVAVRKYTSNSQYDALKGFVCQKCEEIFDGFRWLKKSFNRLLYKEYTESKKMEVG